MPNFDSNDPSAFGWQLGTAYVVPFVYRGHQFYSGLDRRLVAVMTLALDRICSQPGFELHTGSGVGDGMWGYEDRNVTGGTVKSFHAYGCALDLNAPWNPYGPSSPPRTPWRLPLNTSELVEPLGLLWGGGPRWGERRDWMHIENHNTPQEAAGYGQPAPAPPPVHPGPGFPLPAGSYYGPFTGPAASVSGVPDTDAPFRAGLQVCQRLLRVSADGRYGPITAAAVRQYQTDHQLHVDGLIGPATWSSLTRG